MRMRYRDGCLFAENAAQKGREHLDAIEEWLEPMRLDARALDVVEELPQRLDLARPQRRTPLVARLAPARRPHVATPATSRGSRSSGRRCSNHSGMCVVRPHPPHRRYGSPFACSLGSQRAAPQWKQSSSSASVLTLTALAARGRAAPSTSSVP